MPDEVPDEVPDDNLLDGCELDFTIDSTPDEEVELVTLFAEALDPNNPKTIAEVEAEWA